MYGTPHIEIVDLTDSSVVAEVREFLSRHALSFDTAVDYTIILRLSGRMIGTGSFKGEVLRNIAVNEDVQGEGYTAIILNELVQEQGRRRIMHQLIFTKPQAASRFQNLGFRLIADATPWAVLLEGGLGGIDDYLSRVQKTCADLPTKRTAVVVNCNPFTRGHLGLLETAARESEAVIVFAVSEDRSLFPFTDRIELIRRGTSHIHNLRVVETGNYMVSSATFPTYFTREEQLADAQAHLDIALFAQKIAPALGIVARYVGEEPYCAVTEAYNRAMRDILPKAGVSLKILPRYVGPDGIPISASTVRDLIRSGDWDKIRPLVPDVTWEYLRSPANQSIIEKIKASHSRH